MAKQMVKYRKLFAYLKKRLAGGEECDHTLRLTKEFAEKHKLSFGYLSEVLQGMGGYCDCEVLRNAADKIPPRDLIGEECFKTLRQIAIKQGFYYREDGEPASEQEAMTACQAGLLFELHVPCRKGASYVYPDLNRASEHLNKMREESPESK